MADFRKIEEKWQKKWEEKKIFEVKEGKKNKFYCLEMFAYPSGSGLHMGHAFNYTIADISARFKRMQGFNVLYPVGYDSLGLPAENAAIKENVHPKKYTEKAITSFIKQQKKLGLSYDWSRMFATHNPEYYKWDQWIFLKMLEKGIAFRKKAAVNFCNKCDTVLANEQVHDGKCWRHKDTDVEIKQLEQWFFKITDYAEELYDYIEKLKEWPEDIKTMQKNWIGKSYGTLVNFKLADTDEILPTFTTRPDTLYGVTFLAFAPEHPRVMELVKGTKYEHSVKEFIDKILIKEKFTRTDKEKEGLFIGRYAINPLTNEKIPIYIANFVLLDYGTGILMCVPAHDQRDFEFAKKYNLPVKVVIEPKDKESINIILNDDDFSAIAQEIRKLAVYKEQVSPEEKSYTLKKISKDVLSKYLKNKNILDQGTNFIIRYPHTQNILELTEAFIGEGNLINSEQFNGMNNREAIKKITEVLEKKKIGKGGVTYRLRDWLISRQRYWGTPIPIVYCDKCGIVPVSEKELPIKLPGKVEFGKGNPLETNKEFVNVKCPKCKGKARRETDTMDTFVNSSWYFLRYCDNKNNKEIFDKKKVKYWMPIDLYIGGKEHACMHLIYFRFYTKFLRDLGLLDIDEPAYRLFNQGMVHGNDGYVMSKSRGNVIDPLDTINKYGSDTLRFYLVSVAGPDKDFLWNDDAIEGSFRFINRIVDYFEKVKFGKSNKKVESKFNKSVKEIADDIENLRYNLAVIKIRELFDSLGDKESKDILEGFLKLLSVFCPHIAEELWSNLGKKSFISLEKWPKADESKIDLELEKQEKQVQKTIEDIRSIFKIIKDKGKEAKKIFLYAIPKEIELYKESKEDMEKLLNAKLEVYAVNDAKKYDPQNKASKAKLGKPAIYLE